MMDDHYKELYQIQNKYLYNFYTSYIFANLYLVISLRIKKQPQIYINHNRKQKGKIILMICFFMFILIKKF